jgi:hypothetical protein
MMRPSTSSASFCRAFLAVVGLALFTPLTAACGSADANANENDTSSDIQGGVADTDVTHAFSVGIATMAGAVCSGTLIAPNLVLTARHCVEAGGGPELVTCADRFSGKNVAAPTLYVTTAPRFHDATKFYIAKEITTPAALEFCGNDIALVTLQENIPAGEAVPATPVIFPMTDRTKIGATVTAMGYGITSPDAKDSGARRIRQDIGLICVAGDPSHTCTDRYAAMIDLEREFVTQGYVCAGDSGGGAFDQASLISGEAYVLGALSRGPETATACLAAIYSRTDAHARMIVTVAQKAAKRGGYAPPAWLALPLAPLPADPPCGVKSCPPDMTTTGPTPAQEPPPPDDVAVRHSACRFVPVPSSPPFGVAAGVIALALVFARRRYKTAPGA